ncbi:glycosyltransferase [Cohnella hongkongensis]|uniref:Glycosyltransferase n=1 Tax=Cohnella hongkongensis TaxID=178337 RepID=A0ABV9FCH0_9BACL
MSDVSVIMPVYNGSAYLKEAISSVLAQTYSSFEFVIVDDGSTDESAAIIESFASIDSRIVYEQHASNRGVSAARNTAIRKSSGSIMMMTDADDIQLPDRLERSLAHLERHKADMVFHDCRLIDEHGKTIGSGNGYPAAMDERNALLYQLQRNYLCSGLSLVRKSPDIAFSSEFPNGEDFALFLTLLLKDYRCSIMPDVLTLYRRHSRNISNGLASSDQTVRNVLSQLNGEELHRRLELQYGAEEAAKSMAAVYLWREQPEKASELLEGLRPAFEVGFLLGVSYYKQNRLSESLNVFRTLHAKQEDAAVMNNLGVLYARGGGERNEAFRWFEEALRVKPGYMDAEHNRQAAHSGNTAQMRFTERPLRDRLVQYQPG